MSLIVMSLLVLLVLLYQYWQREVFFKRDIGTVEAKGGLSSPVDGTLVYVRHGEPGPVYSSKLEDDIYAMDMNEPFVHIGIYMSIFDRHYVCAPCDCRIESVEHWGTGLNLPMLDLIE